VIQFLGFVFGQVLAILLQWTFWMNDSRAWIDYWHSRRHQAQHVRDSILSGVAMLAYGAGILRVVADKVGAAWLTEAIPDEIGWAMAALAGFALCFVTRMYAQRKWFDLSQDDPPPPPTATKGDSDHG